MSNQYYHQVPISCQMCIMFRENFSRRRICTDQTMKLYLLFLSASYYLLFCEGANMKIINGDEVAPHSRPYMALIETLENNKKTLCCGSLIKSDWVLTAAHCNLTAGQTTVTLGAHSRKQNETEKQKITVVKVYVFKSYNSSTKQNDIQLVQLSQKARLGKAVNILLLPKTFEDLKKGTVCRIAGWGRTEREKLADMLLETNVTILDREKCKKVWKKMYDITTDMLCTNVGAKGQDSCKGDSGGPLICDDVFRGLNSFGYNPCGTPKTSNVFTRLTKTYISWIQETIGYQNSEE
ncbi:granzyme A-like [Rana temporaria]|uniref:granzyme A-like n=1 Tax=Rana temporaria TaxID=8407 RepID=UPI001AAD4FFB|nr:granzyme A-like [Rana temporaria]